MWIAVSDAAEGKMEAAAEDRTGWRHVFHGEKQGIGHVRHGHIRNGA